MGHKILLADDSITIQKVIELTFSDEDFELHTVGNGQKAIDEIRSLQPDIVLCDIIMPEKNGYEVCEYIKSNDDTKHIPVLLLTGAFEPFDQERAKAAGCEGFLAKPFEPQTLISKVKELLEGASGAPVSPSPSAGVAASPLDPVITQNATPVASVQPVPPAPVEPFEPIGADETVLVPPPSTCAPAPPPVAGPQVPAAPTPVPTDMSPPGLDEGFAIEAGERELSMDPGDHTMLLGGSEVSEAPVPPPTPPGAGDDIWSEALPPEPPSPPPLEPVPPPAAPLPTPPPPPLMSTPPGSEEEPDAATVFMASPPPIIEPGDAGLGAPAPVDSEMEVGTSDPDATWQMPLETPAAPVGELGGFEDFAAPSPPPVENFEVPPAADLAPPAAPNNLAGSAGPLGMEPPPDSDTSAPPLDPLVPEPPQLERSSVPPVTPEPIPSVDTQATIDPVLAGAEAFPPISPPAVVPDVPSLVDTPELSDVPAMTTEPETPFTPLEPLIAPPPAAAEPAPPVEVAPLPSPPPPPAPLEPAPAGPAASVEPDAPSSEPASSADDDLVERVAQRVVDKLSAKVIQEIAWEVVPDLAEGLIQKEIDDLKSKIPRTG